MKKKIFLLFLTFSLCFILGGLYITRSIDQVILRLEDIVTLHQVEIFRKTLLADVKIIQQDLLLFGSPHATRVDTFVQHAENMEDSVERCFECHHDSATTRRLEQLRHDVLAFQNGLGRVYTIRGNARRLEDEKGRAFDRGQDLTGRIETLLTFSSKQLAERTQSASEDILRTKLLLTLLLVLGPTLLLFVAMFLARRFTDSIAVLLNATRALKAGNLDHRTKGLRNEFGELGESFNEMATSLKEVIQTIEETQKRYRMLFENAGDAIFILDAEGEVPGRIVSANQAAAKMHGYTVEEILELSIQDLDTPESAEEASGRMQRILEGEWITGEISHQRKDGSLFPVELSAGLLELDDKKYVLAFDKDITERKQGEEALQRAEQLVSVGVVSAGLAHEIKNPLAGIKVCMEVLVGELSLRQEDKEVFRQITDEINRIENLLKNLLSYAKPPAPKLILLDINKIIEAAVKHAQFSLKSPAQKSKSQKPKKIKFVRNLSDQIPKTFADPAQLHQVFLNLLLNAVHAISDTGTITVTTSIYMKDHIRIVVSDTGRGVSGEDIDRLFQPFFTTKPKGTGLGLSICKRLIEQQNGTIRAARSPEGGLMFTISLPVGQAGEVYA